MVQNVTLIFLRAIGNLPIFKCNKKHTVAISISAYFKTFAGSSPVVKMRDQAYRICRDYLSGSWKSISSSDMVFRSISGGMSNLLYYCSLPETHTPLVGEPNQVLMRMYGQIHDGVESTVTESVIFMMLSERKLGPKLYGIFPGGRLEEYIPARAMTCDELKDPDVSITIGRKLAKVHSLNVPINKEPTWLFERMAKWLDSAKSVCLESLSEDKQVLAKDLMSCDLYGEFLWLKDFLSKADSPVVFCHNDLQEGNILVPEGASASDNKVIFIDFEYCSYNFRGFDLANHFCEWCFDYSYPEYPHFLAKLEEFPTLDQQRNFVRSYLGSAEEGSLGTVLEDSEVNTEEHILHEVQCFILASHFLWTLWSIVNAQNSQIEFGYWEYGKARLGAYFKCKDELVRRHIGACEAR